MKPTVKTVRQNQNIIFLGAENMTLEDVPADGDLPFPCSVKAATFLWHYEICVRDSQRAIIMYRRWKT